MFSNISHFSTYGSHKIKSIEIFFILESCKLSNAVIIFHLFPLCISFKASLLRVCTHILTLLIHNFSQAQTFSGITLNGVVSKLTSIFSVNLYLFFTADIILDHCSDFNTPGVPPPKYNVFKGCFSCINSDCSISEIRLCTYVSICKSCKLQMEAKRQ
jgi:hypothetical protein